MQVNPQTFVSLVLMSYLRSVKVILCLRRRSYCCFFIAFSFLSFFLAFFFDFFYISYVSLRVEFNQKEPSTPTFRFSYIFRSSILLSAPESWIARVCANWEKWKVSALWRACAISFHIIRNGERRSFSRAARFAGGKEEEKEETRREMYARCSKPVRSTGEPVCKIVHALIAACARATRIAEQAGKLLTRRLAHATPSCKLAINFAIA